MKSYARARLWVGITGVGSIVLLSLLLLFLGAPTQLFAETSGLLNEARGVALFLGAIALLALPFDVLGGLLLPRAFGRSTDDAWDFAFSWVRGVSVLIALSSIASSTLHLEVLSTSATGGGGPGLILRMERRQSGGDG